MAKKKAAAKEVERKVLSNGVILIKYDDGSYALLTPISAEDAEEIFGGESEDSDDEDEDDEDEDLAGMDFEALEDLCDDKELETDPDEFDEEDVEKLRKAVAKELGITLPKAKAASSKDTKKKKK
mgnify:CR=1 FL=1